MIKHVISDLEPYREKKVALERRPGDVQDVLVAGNRVAQKIASETMNEVRDAITL
jgi:tryptophanyl-tRNA synthetase